MTTFYVDDIKHTNHMNKSTGFPKLVVNGSYFLAFPDKGYKGKYEFSDWMYFEGPIVLTKDNKRYRVAATGLGGFSTVKFNAYFSLGSAVSNVDYRPTVGSYYPGSQVYSNYSISGGTIYLSGNRSGTYQCLSSGRVYSHWTPGYSYWVQYYYDEHGIYHYLVYPKQYWHKGYWSTEVKASSFKRVE